MKQLEILDSTLRDGCQGEGISFTVADKLRVAEALDDLGVAYIEAGNPGSNPKDLDFFLNVDKLNLKNSKLVAFGSTRRKAISAETDNGIKAIMDANTPSVAIFGKSSILHVKTVLNTTPEENLAMISDTLAYFKAKGKEVFYDAEHFFDGYKLDSDYAMQTLKAAVDAGADCLVLCDTNGGCFPDEIYEITKLVVKTFACNVGIHCHNDGGMGVANSIAAVDAGAIHVQGTLLGFGERCGNANLSTIIPNLQLKKDYNCIPNEKMQDLTTIAVRIAEIANIKVNNTEPYVGSSAFAHKAGMHIDGVNKDSKSFEHISPDTVGNERRFLVSEMAGRTSILKRIREVNPDLTKESPETGAIIDRIKELEHLGYQFEGADGTFELIVRKQLGKYRPFFELVNYSIVTGYPHHTDSSATASIKVIVDGQTEITAADGNGPVNALDKALRKALVGFYPNLDSVHLIDYKVRVMESKSATAAKVRVLIESTDGISAWTTVGVSSDIIEASWIALVDSIEYKLMKDIERKFKNMF